MFIVVGTRMHPKKRRQRCPCTRHVESGIAASQPHASSPHPFGQSVPAQPPLRERRSSTRVREDGLTRNDVKSDSGDERIGVSNGFARYRNGILLCSK
jgi:hypothetical protein